VKTAAETFVANPDLDVAKTIGQLGVGEALVSMLQDKGVPMPVEKTLIAPPRCRMGAITEAERAQVRAGSPVGAKYDKTIDRESAAEKLAARHADGDAGSQASTTKADNGRAAQSQQDEGGGFGGAVKDALFGTKRRQGMIETMAKQTARTVGSQDGRQILRGVLGGIFGGRK
jgi:DNA helicase HerA-like ATPase